MRISDWSSDVCSSDLDDGLARHLALLRLDDIERRRDFAEQIVPQRTVVRFVEKVAQRLGDRRADAVGAHLEDRLDRVELAARIFAVGLAFLARIGVAPGAQFGRLAGQAPYIAQSLEQTAPGHRADRSEERR